MFEFLVVPACLGVAGAVVLSVAMGIIVAARTELDEGGRLVLRRKKKYDKYVLNEDGELVRNEHA